MHVCMCMTACACACGVGLLLLTACMPLPPRGALCEPGSPYRAQHPQTRQLLQSVPVTLTSCAHRPRLSCQLTASCVSLFIYIHTRATPANIYPKLHSVLGKRDAALPQSSATTSPIPTRGASSHSSCVCLALAFAHHSSVHLGSLFCLDSPCFRPCFSYCRRANALLHSICILSVVAFGTIRGRWSPSCSDSWIDPHNRTKFHSSSPGGGS
mgnify:CR=1 FL=1